MDGIYSHGTVGYPVAASTALAHGALVWLDTTNNVVAGYADGRYFVGAAALSCDNTYGAAGEKKVAVKPDCYVRTAVVGVTTAADLLASVYDNGSGVLTKTATGTAVVGKIVGFHAEDATCDVHLEANYTTAGA